MKQRAFVVMPFGASVVVSDGGESKDPIELVDFVKVYTDLIEPALNSAGCEAFRADKEVSAGDIRTDMFFELATADFVVAEVSALNPNVFYELGVRNGLCKRGVFLIRGDWPWAHPFDIAPDRTFTYKSALFKKGNTEAVPATDIQGLADVLLQAIKADPQKIGSPVYALLPGLKPADMTGIKTSRALYFTTIQDGWTERVRNAQRKGRPGNIITLAEDAPTPVHRVEILFEAAKALIGLCRYGPAEKILRQVLAIDPDHREARMQLGQILQHVDQPMQAEDEMRNFIERFGEDPEASERLGNVYRHLWRLSWKCVKTPSEERDNSSAPEGHNSARKLAKENISLALLAYHNFFRAHWTQPEVYFNGFNAALLLAIVDHLFDGKRPDDFGAIKVQELIVPVRFAAECARRRADATGKHDEHFWSTTTLSGLALLEANNLSKAAADGNNSADADCCRHKSLQLIKDACAFPQTTLFQIESLRQRLTLLLDLGFERSFTKEAIKAIDEAARSSYRSCEDNSIGKVDRENVQIGSEPRRSKIVLFNGDGESDLLKRTIDEALGHWSVGTGDLAIATGIREADLLFAELCHERGATVRLLLLDPSPQDIVWKLWPTKPDECAERFQRLASQAERVSIWRHAEELGPPPLNESQAKCRHNRWVMHTARAAAEGAPQPADFCGIVVVNNGDAGNDQCDPTNPEHPAFFVAEIRQSLNYQGTVKVIRSEALKPIGVAAAHS